MVNPVPCSVFEISSYFLEEGVLMLMVVAVVTVKPGNHVVLSMWNECTITAYCWQIVD